MTEKLLPYLLPFGLNAICLLLAWQVHGGGLFYFTRDSLGLDFLTALFLIVNTSFCLIAWFIGNMPWVKGFAITTLLLLAGCGAEIVHGVHTGATS